MFTTGWPGASAAAAGSPQTLPFHFVVPVWTSHPSSCTGPVLVLNFQYPSIMVRTASPVLVCVRVRVRASIKPGFQLNATHATQPIALRALRKRKLQETQAIVLRAMRALRKRKPQAFDWLL